LKGALNLFARYGQIARATEDIDLAARGLPNTLEQAPGVFQQLYRVPFADGLQFDPGSVTGRTINETLRYSSVALTLRATLGSSQISLPNDKSSGNVITPAASRLDFPALLLDQAVRVAVYPLETIVTEKFAAFAELGEATTRMKDFYDLQLILPRGTFEADLMRRSFHGSFEARGTPLNQVAQVLSEGFGEDGLLAGRWKPYLRRTGLIAPPFDEVLRLLRRFYSPLLLQAGEPGTWVAGQWDTGPAG